MESRTSMTGWIEFYGSQWLWLFCQPQRGIFPLRWVLPQCSTTIAQAKSEKNIHPQNSDLCRTDLIYFSAIPWVDYTAMTLPVMTNRAGADDQTYNTVPCVGWGKYVREGEKFQMSMHMKISHAFVDGKPLDVYKRQGFAWFAAPACGFSLPSALSLPPFCGIIYGVPLTTVILYPTIVGLSIVFPTFFGFIFRRYHVQSSRRCPAH